MNVIKTAIDGVVIIEPRIFEDARGYFFESFSQREFNNSVGITFQHYTLLWASYSLSV
jgi:dTDP-4-dehydrorhamnose 3,5-epimerase